MAMAMTIVMVMVMALPGNCGLDDLLQPGKKLLAKLQVQVVVALDPVVRHTVHCTVHCTVHSALHTLDWPLTLQCNEMRPTLLATRSPFLHPPTNHML